MTTNAENIAAVAVRFVAAVKRVREADLWRSLNERSERHHSYLDAVRQYHEAMAELAEAEIALIAAVDGGTVDP